MHRAMKVLSGVVFATAISGLTWSCADKGTTTEPVAADDKAPKVPDMPGAGSGEGKDKAAGVGTAAEPEKSAPNTEAAAKATKGRKGKAAKGAAAPVSNLKPGEATIDGDLVNVRASGAMTANVVKKMKKGEKVTIKECKLGWCEVGEGQFVGAKMLKQ